MRKLYGLLEDAAARWPGRVFLEFEGRAFTYAEMAAMADAVAKGLKARGLAPGMRVALCLPNCPYYVAYFYGILKAGGVVVNLNPLYTADELLGLVRDSGAAAVVGVDVPLIWDKLVAIQDKVPDLRLVLCPLGEMMPYWKGVAFKVFKAANVRKRLGVMNHAELLNGAGDRLVQQSGAKVSAELALLQYTGGTTGTPKGAMLTHANLLANTDQCVDRLSDKGADKTGTGLRILAVLPLFHVFALTSTLLMGARLGATLILLPRFTPRTLLRVIRERRPTLLPGVPALFDALALLPEVSKADFASVRHGVRGGAPLPPVVRDRFEAVSGVILREGYGLTEASPVVACTLTTRRKAGSVGLPLKGTKIEIRDARGRKLKTGATGEVWLKGPQVMAGYWNDPAETGLVLRDGWLNTGDVGHVDKDGWLFMTDRVKDIIIVNGYKVYPRMVEEALQTHPAVAEVLVAGIAHPHKGEVPKAFIKLKDGATLSAEDVKAFAAARLNPMERPAEVEFRDSLPKTFIGKPTRKGLKT
jgi:long-chain acyl-CoA synthetase